MKAYARTLCWSVSAGAAVALFPYVLDALIPPDPGKWIWVPPWEWPRLPGELIAGGATPNMTAVNAINAALYSAAAFPFVWWRRRKSRRTRAF